MLLRAIWALTALGFWWLVCRPWLGGGPRHKSYNYARWRQWQHAELLRRFLEGV